MPILISEGNGSTAVGLFLGCALSASWPDLHQATLAKPTEPFLEAKPVFKYTLIFKTLSTKKPCGSLNSTNLMLQQGVSLIGQWRLVHSPFKICVGFYLV